MANSAKLLLRLWDAQGRTGPYIDLPEGDYASLSSTEAGRFQDRAAFLEVVRSDDGTEVRVPPAFASRYASAPLRTDADLRDALNPSNTDRIEVVIYDYDNFGRGNLEGKGAFTFRSPEIALPAQWQDELASVKFRVSPAPAARLAAAEQAAAAEARRVAAEARKAKAAAAQAAAAARPIRPVEFTVGDGGRSITTVEPKASPEEFPEDFRDVSDGQTPAALGLPKPLIGYTEGVGYAPAVEEFESVKAAAAAGDPGARMALASVGL